VTAIIISFIASVVLTELLTELVVKSEIFKSFRQFLEGFTWVSKLVNCGYCFSVWSALLVTLVVGPRYDVVSSLFLNYIIISLIVHRSSNVWHNIIDKWTDKYYDLRYVNTDKV
jgi:hypothetical protein